MITYGSVPPTAKIIGNYHIYIETCNSASVSNYILTSLPAPVDAWICTNLDIIPYMSFQVLKIKKYKQMDANISIEKAISKF